MEWLQDAKPLLLVSLLVLFSDSLGFNPAGLYLFAFTCMLVFFNKMKTLLCREYCYIKDFLYGKLSAIFKWED